MKIQRRYMICPVCDGYPHPVDGHMHVDLGCNRCNGIGIVPMPKTYIHISSWLKGFILGLIVAACIYLCS